MEYLCKYSHYSLTNSFFSILATNNPEFEILDDNEGFSTAETIIARVTYSFSLMKSQLPKLDSLQSNIKNFQQCKELLTEMIKSAEDSATRLAKIYFTRDILWAGLKNQLQQLEHIPELNYFLSEGFYL